jgi:IS5 family transposase
VLVTGNLQQRRWETFLPPEYQQLPAGLARVDALLDDPVFFAPYAAHFPALSGGRRSRSGPACG